jgi:hypothetical protein
MCLTLNSAWEWAGAVVVVAIVGSFHHFGCRSKIFVATSIFQISGHHLVFRQATFQAAGTLGWEGGGGFIPRIIPAESKGL